MILALDVGGTFAKLGLVTDEGEVLCRSQVPVDFDGYATPVFDTAVCAIRRFLSDTGAAPEGIAVCATGQIDSCTGIITDGNDLIRNYVGTPVRDMMAGAFHLPVSAINDANAAALGECWTGAGKGVQDVIMVTLGTGVGGGIVSGGRLLEGALGGAGEIGLMPFYGAPFEERASTLALVLEAQKASGLSGLSGREVFERAQNGEQVFLDVLDRWIGRIAEGLTGLVYIFNPALILIGGGVSAQQKLLIEPLRSRLHALVRPGFLQGLALKAAKLGNDAGMVGAVRYFLTQRQK